MTTQGKENFLVIIFYGILIIAIVFSAIAFAEEGIKTAADGSYPLSKPLYIVTTAKTAKPAQKLITFIFSPAGRKILSANGNLAVERKTVK